MVMTGVCLSSEEAECPICYNPLGERAGPCMQDSIGCARGHNICTSCARKIVKPCSSVPTGLVFECPVCRTHGVVTRIHLMVLLKGTWRDARKCFEGESEETKWVQSAARTDWSPAALECV